MPEPTRSVSEYCDAFRDWREALRAKLSDPECSEDDRTRYQPVLEALDLIELPIVKSSYLGRRIYDGEPHRTEKCPTHRGLWVGLYAHPCDEGCGHVGWIPARHAFEPIDEFPGPDDTWRWGFENVSAHCKHCGGLEAALVHDVDNRRRG